MRRIEFSNDELREVYLRTLSTRKTAEHFGVAKGTIQNRLKELGIEERGTPQVMTPEQEASIVEMAKSGMRIGLVIRATGFSNTTLYRIVEKHGVTFQNTFHKNTEGHMKSHKKRNKSRYVRIYTPHHPHANSGGWVV